MTKQEFIEKLRLFIMEETDMNDPSEMQDTTLFFESGILDSVTFVSLISYCEELLDCNVAIDSLTEKNFGSLETVADYFGSSFDG